MTLTTFLPIISPPFPESSITPKLHSLENHVVPFIHLWRVGLGMMGEQGAESIHARVNTLERFYCSMPNKVEQLKSFVLEHLRQVCPMNIVKQPPPLKQQRKENTTSHLQHLATANCADGRVYTVSNSTKYLILGPSETPAKKLISLAYNVLVTLLHTLICLFFFEKLHGDPLAAENPN